MYILYMITFCRFIKRINHNIFIFHGIDLIPLNCDNIKTLMCFSSLFSTICKPGDLNLRFI